MLFVDVSVINLKRILRVLVLFIGQVMFNNVLFKKLPPETGISVVCLSPGVVQTNVVSIIHVYLHLKCGFIFIKLNELTNLNTLIKLFLLIIKATPNENRKINFIFAFGVCACLHFSKVIYERKKM